MSLPVSFPDEETLLKDFGPIEHKVDFQVFRVLYPFSDMDKYDFFRIGEERQAQATRSAAQRFYAKSPGCYFVVRRHDDEWICRRVV